MKGRISLLLALIFVFSPVGCARKTNETEARTDTLESLLLDLNGEDIGCIQWLIDIENRPSAGEVATIINSAMAHTVDREPMTPDGSETDVVWGLDIFIGDPNADGWSGDDAFHLYAGLTENLVEVFGGDNLPDGRIWVEDKALYQLIRTMMDTPDGEIDQRAYEAYKDSVDSYLAQAPDYVDGVTARRELIGFTLEAENEKLGAEVYTINDVCIVDPPEKAPQLLAGGAYVDSRLRIHGDGEAEQNNLVVVDGQPVGFVSWEFLNHGGLDQFSAKEELIAAVQGGNL